MTTIAYCFTFPLLYKAGLCGGSWFVASTRAGFSSVSFYLSSLNNFLFPVSSIFFLYTPHALLTFFFSVLLFSKKVKYETASRDFPFQENVHQHLSKNENWWIILSRYFWMGYGLWGKIDTWNFVGTKYGILSQSCPTKCQIFKGGIDGSYHVVCVLEMCWPIVVSFPPHTTYGDDSSEIFNSFTRIRCLQESIPQQNCVESMPGPLKV